MRAIGRQPQRDRTYEPIAIIGAGCRLPGDQGDLTSLDDFADFVSRGGDAVGPMPASRWNVDAVYSEDPAARGRMYVKRGAFLDWDFREFDAAFYGISPREAAIMDPQQRLVMDVALDCLHDAKADFDALVGSATGVFIGGFMLDHLTGNGHFSVRERISNHSATSAQMTMLSNRLSYSLGLQGPSLTVDTACSSSLVAIHLACRALQVGDADMCLAGGVNFMLRAITYMMLCKGQFLAKDGRSKSFDASADGYGRGEGCGIIALKRLCDAQADGDNVIAVIAGSGVNQDGATAGITVPNAEAQANLMHKVYAEAEVSAKDLDFFEAHGTGTPIGDPLEVSAMQSVLEAHGADQRVVLGSVKAGIGHQEAVAGVAGLLKAAVSVRAGKVGPQAWIDEVNPVLGLDDSPLELAVEPMTIGRNGQARLAAVNSFGYGGTNAHALVASHV